MILKNGSDIARNRLDCFITISSFFIRAAVYMRRNAATVTRHPFYDGNKADVFHRRAKSEKSGNVR